MFNVFNLACKRSHLGLVKPPKKYFNRKKLKEACLVFVRLAYSVFSRVSTIFDSNYLKCKAPNIKKKVCMHCSKYRLGLKIKPNKSHVSTLSLFVQCKSLIFVKAQIHAYDTHL